MVTVESLLPLLGAEESERESISRLLAEGEQYIRLVCRLSPGENIPDALLSRIVREDYTRLSGEGLLSRSVSGVTERYLSDYSEAVKRGLYAIRHPATGKKANP